MFTYLLQKTAMDMLPSKASEGDFIRNGLVSEDFTLSGVLFRIEVRPCLRRSGYAQAGRSLSEEHTHVRLVKILCSIWV
jgi:hypothetical protein